jgi:hypothetical protein
MYPRSSTVQGHENFSLTVVLRSFLHPKLEICTPLAVIHEHKAEWIHQPWPKAVRVKDKQLGIDQVAMQGYAERRPRGWTRVRDDRGWSFDGGGDPQAAIHCLADHRSRVLARTFHEGGCVCHVFAKQINLMGKHLGVFVQGQFLPIHFQEKCAVTA